MPPVGHSGPRTISQMPPGPASLHRPRTRVLRLWPQERFPELSGPRVPGATMAAGTAGRARTCLGESDGQITDSVPLPGPRPVWTGRGGAGHLPASKLRVAHTGPSSPCVRPVPHPAALVLTAACPQPALRAPRQTLPRTHPAGLGRRRSQCRSPGGGPEGRSETG